MKKFWSVFLLCCLGLGGIFFLFRIKSVRAPVVSDHHSVILPVHTLKEEPFTYTKSFIGSVQAIQSVAVVPYLSGYLKEVRVQSGDEVEEGQILFVLDERIPLAELNQAKEAVEQAHATFENAKTYYERVEQTDSQAISLIDLEQAKTEFEAAEAAYQKALAEKNQAETMYNYTIIKAPISGWVGNITATAGEYLSPESKALATIVRFSPIRLVFSVPMAAFVRDPGLEGATLKVALADDRVLTFNEFKVVRDNQANSATDSLSFFADVLNDEKSLIPGAYVEIRFLFPEKGILVDKNWITLTPDGAEAALLRDGIVEKQSVQIMAPIGQKYWIKSGLKSGDDIIMVPVSPYQIGQPAQGDFK